MNQLDNYLEERAGLQSSKGHRLQQGTLSNTDLTDGVVLYEQNIGTQEQWDSPDHYWQRNLCSYLRVTVHNPLSPPFRHRHDFIELNYLYRGHCTNTVSGVSYDMQPGDLVIYDTRTYHSIDRIGPKDLLINIILLPREAASVLQALLPGGSPLSAFVAEAASGAPRTPNYLYFRMGSTREFHRMICDFLTECFFPRSHLSSILLDCHLRSLLTLLAQEYELHPDAVSCAYQPNGKAAEITRYIQTHCRDCTREGVAQQFGYSKGHLSALLSAHTGKTFLQLRNDFRLDAIQQELQTSNKPVKTLAQEYGFFNTTYFYRLYRTRFGHVPREDRRVSPEDSH